MPRLTALIRQLHIYTGLQALIAVVVFGLAGLGATWTHDPSYELPEARHWKLPLEVGPDATPRQLGDCVWKQLAVPLSTPPANWRLKPNAEGALEFKIGTLNTETEVRIARGAREAEISHRRLSWPELFVELHSARLRPAKDTFLPIRLWSFYIELSVWSLWFFLASGLYLWLAVKPWRPLALWSFASGWVACAAGVIWMW